MPWRERERERRETTRMERGENVRTTVSQSPFYLFAAPRLITHTYVRYLILLSADCLYFLLLPMYTIDLHGRPRWNFFTSYVLPYYRAIPDKSAPILRSVKPVVNIACTPTIAMCDLYLLLKCLWICDGRYRIYCLVETKHYSPARIAF